MRWMVWLWVWVVRALGMGQEPVAASPPARTYAEGEVISIHHGRRRARGRH